MKIAWWLVWSLFLLVLPLVPSAAAITCPVAVTDLHVSSTSAGTITIAWTPPFGQDGYEVFYSTTGTGSWAFLQNLASSATSYADSALGAGVTRYYEIYDLCSDAITPVGPSNVTHGTTPTAPGTPTSVSAGGISSSQVTVQWSAPTSNGGSSVTGYTVYGGLTVGSGEETTFPCNSGHRLVTVGSVSSPWTDNSGLSPATTYYYKVTASNAVDEGACSSAVSGTTAGASGTAPDAPRNMVAVDSGTGGAVDLSWDPPASNGGSAIIFYNVYWSSSTSTFACTNPSAANAGPGGLTYHASGLTNNVTYNFTVSASNSAGTSGCSNEPTAKPTTWPTAPTSPSAVALSSTQTRVSWSLPSSNGTNPVIGYATFGGLTTTDPSFACSASTRLTSAGSIAASPWTDTSGLSPGTTYYYRVSASSIDGEGACSSVVSATTWTTPGLPQSVTVGSATTSTLAVSWSAPSSNGGTSVTGYTVYGGLTVGSGETLSFACDVSHRLTSIGTASSPWTDNSGLSPGTTYYYKVSASNGVGEGGCSPAANGTTLTPTPPGAPTSPSASAGPGAREVTVSWSAPSSSGSAPVTGYKVYGGLTASSGSFACDSGHLVASPSASPFVDNGGLADATQYFYKVAAVNSVGTGACTSAVSATTWDVPSEPWNLTGVPGDGQAAMSWHAPNSTVGTITYTLFRETAPGAPCTDAVISGLTDLAFTSTGLLNQHDYWFSVRATNEVGDGTCSAEVLVRPNGPESVSPELGMDEVSSWLPIVLGIAGAAGVLGAVGVIMRLR